MLKHRKSAGKRLQSGTQDKKAKSVKGGALKRPSPPKGPPC